ncbi:ubiquinol-cytochrome c reductase complex a protein [Pyrenophora tritici-repentis]|uniref:Cytochrome b-c1 complex subunit 7 n=2 Tax=Pyrenophora tritici-repentis TaxID=45151 RepID=A0A2W1FRT4_9PLEO|nr:ubiquinol-cytochrome c reductase complex 14 kDa protein [Pyrenophora tritici-repentis Pt-1C-BFP]KAA8619508.1 Cytochrome b-c1 complex subunit 7 [Pyrenophora tritici-repentis]EDU47236.1 ubiquinol-cytochrome c reductase complex 14 kDa protein [Pyrenophora tritici-repentis Pt-1C-BFP]KAF7447652.1 Cytochrome b-c1 complex protein [Pyrenophora tritici-repentis]KAF7571340.1 ubiquinol-cytochrome c reductase complex a protein [Pyrenophora tritici-repentis]KAG9385423.1 Cytochrome b-c1 complex protein [
MSAPSLAPYIMKRPWLQRWVKPLSNWYCNAAGYRQLGLRADDLLPEENDTVQNALKRLRPQDAYDRVFRLRRAFQLSMSHQLLPKEEWTKPEEDVPYLSGIITDIEAEMKEREDLETMIVQKRQKNAATGH